MDSLPPMAKEKRLNHPSRKGRRDSGNLREQIFYRMLPTPTQSDYKGSCRKVIRNDGKKRDRLDYVTELNDPTGGRLNPAWVEWLMGFPEGWTELEG
jgi:DNA (cytosine-5)-methyltransferase 1